MRNSFNPEKPDDKYKDVSHILHTGGPALDITGKEIVPTKESEKMQKKELDDLNKTLLKSINNKALEENKDILSKGNEEIIKTELLSDLLLSYSDRKLKEEGIKFNFINVSLEITSPKEKKILFKKEDTLIFTVEVKYHKPHGEDLTIKNKTELRFFDDATTNKKKPGALQRIRSYSGYFLNPNLTASLVPKLPENQPQTDAASPLPPTTKSS